MSLTERIKRGKPVPGPKADPGYEILPTGRQPGRSPWLDRREQQTLPTKVRHPQPDER